MSVRRERQTMLKIVTWTKQTWTKHYNTYILAVEWKGKILMELGEMSLKIKNHPCISLQGREEVQATIPKENLPP